MHKKDEMELQVANKSIKITWITTVIALFVAGYSEFFGIDTFFDGTSGYRMIAVLSVVLYIFLERFFFSRLTEKKLFTKFFWVVIFITFLMISATIFMVR